MYEDNKSMLKCYMFCQIIVHYIMAIPPVESSSQKSKYISLQVIRLESSNHVELWVVSTTNW